MKCPLCVVEFGDHPPPISVGVEPGGTGWMMVKQTCPACKRFIHFLEQGAQSQVNMVPFKDSK
jgi:hypothetical protein